MTSADMKPGESMVWKIDIEAYPDPLITWSKDGDEDIIKQHSKFNVMSDRKKTVLEIKGLEMEDSGVYQVEVIAKDIIRTLNYTLRVVGMSKTRQYDNPSST